MVRENGAVEYLFTKREKYPVELDKPDVPGELIDKESGGEPGIYLYLNSCMLKVASKHRQFCY